MTALVATPPARRSAAAWLREPGMGATVLVGAISTAFGVVLLSVTEYVATLIDPAAGVDATVMRLDPVELRAELMREAARARGSVRDLR